MCVCVCVCVSACLSVWELGVSSVLETQLSLRLVWFCSQMSSLWVTLSPVAILTDIFHQCLCSLLPPTPGWAKKQMPSQTFPTYWPNLYFHKEENLSILSLRANDLSGKTRPLCGRSQEGLTRSECQPGYLCSQSDLPSPHTGRCWFDLSRNHICSTWWWW